MSRRLERVASVIRTVLGRAIPTELSDPRIPPITSITRVDVSADFAVAHVYVSILAPDNRRQLAVDALQSAAGRLRRILGRELRLRQTPALDFRLDESVRRSFETVQALDRLMAELGGRPADGPDVADGPPSDNPNNDEPGRAGAAGAQEDP